MIIIPETFVLANREWRVKWITDRTMRKKNDGIKTWGVTFQDRAIIYMNKQLLTEENEELMWHTWEHELSHALLFAYGVVGTDHNEREIDGIAALRCQYYQTREGEEDDGDS